MRAPWYERQGPARDVLSVGEMPDPIPVAGEVPISIAASGINPGDIPKHMAADQGACLGIPGITAHRAPHVAGPVNRRTVLVQGAAGSVGLRAVQLARYARARVIGTIRVACG